MNINYLIRLSYNFLKFASMSILEAKNILGLEDIYDEDLIFKNHNKKMTPYVFMGKKLDPEEIKNINEAKELLLKNIDSIEHEEEFDDEKHLFQPQKDLDKIPTSGPEYYWIPSQDKPVEIGSQLGAFSPKKDWNTRENFLEK